MPACRKIEIVPCFRFFYGRSCCACIPRPSVPLSRLPEPRSHPDKLRHRHMNLFLSRLDEQQRRWYVGLQSLQRSEGSDERLSLITGLDEKTIRKGRTEVEQGFEGRPTDRVRREGGGRLPLEAKIPR
jgi:hypothetical protein